MKITLWVLQALLVAFFLLAGAVHLFMPIEELGAQLRWVTMLQPWHVRIIGAFELAGALGLVLPALTGIAPGLTPVSALGLAVIMALAAVVHVSIGEGALIVVNIVPLVIGLVVAYGRWRVLPVRGRAKQSKPAVPQAG